MTKRILRVISMFVMVAMISTQLFPAAALAAAKVEIPVGTIVRLNSSQTISGNSVAVGDTVIFTVAEDVVVDGNVVIKAGSTATGSVVTAKKANMAGVAGELGISVSSVKAVDGTLVALSGTKVLNAKDNMPVSIGLGIFLCVLFFLMKGDEAVLTPSVLFEARTVAATPINVN